MIWITADTHFSHAAIIKHTNRPFKTIQEMDEALISNWNMRVKKNDIVYHLGDFSWKPPEIYLNRLNGKVHLIRGNHEFRMSKKHFEGFEFIKDVYQLKYNGMKFWMSHYAHRTWPSKGYGSIHCFGHSHGALDDYGLSTDVGVDCSERLIGRPYSPISIDEIAEHMAGKLLGGGNNREG